MSILDMIYPVGSIVFGKHPTIGRWELIPRGYVIETTDQQLTVPYSLRTNQVISANCLTKQIFQSNESGEHSHQNRELLHTHSHEIHVEPHTHLLNEDNIEITGTTVTGTTGFTNDDTQICDKCYQLSTNQGWVWVPSIGINSGGSQWTCSSEYTTYAHTHPVPPLDVNVDSIDGITNPGGEINSRTSNSTLQLDLPSTYAAGSHRHVIEIGSDNPEEFYNKAVITQAFVRVS